MVLTGCNVFIQFPGIRGLREGVETQNRWVVARDLTVEQKLGQAQTQVIGL